jgi:hypothetical protein
MTNRYPPTVTTSLFTSLSAIVRNLQDIVEKDHELVSASHAEK